MDLPGRGDVNPYGIPVANPHEAEGPEPCVVCGEEYPRKGATCERCLRNLEEDRLDREHGR